MGLKILIVDDILENITSLIQAIGSDEIQFVAARSGAEALKKLTHEDDFDLALVDVQMPEMNGYELAQLMRGVERTKNIPIIFITAQFGTAFGVLQGYDVGAIDFLVKPVNIKMLQAKIDVFRRLKAKRVALNEKIQELEATKKILEVSERKAREADEVKSAFLAHMSHEIRTPITALLGFADLLEPVVKHHTKGSEYLGIIKKNSHHLLDLINDILDLSKIEAGQLEYDVQTVSVQKVMADVFNLLMPLASKAQVELIFKNERSEETFALADPKRLRQVIINIVGNAIKFSPRNRVEVWLEEKQASNGGELLELVVRDYGIGIDPAHVDSLFKPFSQIRSQQAENSFSSGTGLGLLLSQRLMRLGGGDLYLKESALGAGSTFAIVVRRAEKSAAAASSDASNLQKSERTYEEKLAALKILLADDSPDNRMLVETMLGHFGARIESVENGSLLVEKVLGSEQKPDVILMDYKMPVLDGLSATKKLREGGCGLPIILLTANAMRGEKEAALLNGATDYVSKPINWDELIEKICLMAPSKDDFAETL